MTRKTPKHCPVCWTPYVVGPLSKVQCVADCPCRMPGTKLVYKKMPEKRWIHRQNAIDVQIAEGKK